MSERYNIITLHLIIYFTMVLLYYNTVIRKKGSLNSIKEKLLNSSLNALDRDELTIYLAYRIQNLVRKNCVLFDIELKYLLCECGQGKLRFDPELLQILLNEVCKIKTTLKANYLNEESTFSYNILPRDLLGSIAKKKFEFIKLIEKSTLKKDYFKNLSIILSKLSRLAKIDNHDIELHQHHIQLAGTINKKNILIHFYPNSWLYPYGPEIWALLANASHTKALPIIIARKIHGISFPFFKEVGMLGFNTYTLLLPENIIKKIETFNSTTFPSDYPDLKIKMKVGPLGNLEDARDNIDSDYYADYHLRTFFEQVILKNIPKKNTYLDQESLEKLSKQNLKIDERLILFQKSIQSLKPKKTQNYLSEWVQLRINLFSN